MSETPRTDAEAFYPHDSKWKVCDADFARRLERELNAANVEIEEKRKDIVYLATEKAKLEERIKRLETLGHEHLLDLLRRVYVNEISADEAYDELEDLIERTERKE